ncbi:MAG: ornithine cyclodeaminase family protein [Alphaproteobacteria bacterium]|nr:ornithine cyclodeaminase family protein [Alphaproteobacteria bacterium]
MALVLSKQEVAGLLKMPALVDAIETALIELSAGTTVNPNRLRIFVPESRSMLACMPAYLGTKSLFGAKIVSSADRPVSPGHPRRLSMMVILADTDGRLLAAMSGAQIGPMRTAATSAVATRHLSRADARTVAIVGCGVQGRAELAGAAAVRKLSDVRVFDTNRAVAEQFAGEMAAELGLRISVADSAEQAVSRADIVTVATTSGTPAVPDAAICPGMHINAVGAHTPRSRELESDTILRARLFAESRAVIMAEAGDVLIPIAENLIPESHLLGEIGEVAAGKIPGRLSREDITVFKSTGMAVEDVIAAKLVYDCAISAGMGATIDF